MKIIQPSFEILRPKENDGIICLQIIEHLGRISHRSEDKQTEDSWKKFIPSIVIGHGDWSITEHASSTVIFRVDRGVTHELVRHRLFSFTQESTRFVNYEKIDQATGERVRDIEFIKPQFGGDDPVNASASWNAEMYRAEQAYKEQIEMGQSPQIARSVLPNALAASIAVTGNLRNWRHFFLMRTSLETHPDMRIITIPLLESFKKRIPILYDDIEPEKRQIDNLKKPR